MNAEKTILKNYFSILNNETIAGYLKCKYCFVDFKKSESIDDLWIKHDEALKILDEALLISPDYTETLINKCAILYKKQRFLEAYDPFRKIPPSNNSEYLQFAKYIIPEKFDEICNEIYSIENKQLQQLL